MLEGDVQRLLHMEEILSRRVVGQDQAIRAVADTVRRARAGIQDAARPLGSFIFLGPTGVGKTELARALAEFLFDDERAMVRLDMSEYMEKHAVARLIGAPPGYVGYEEGGQLTEAIKRRPMRSSSTRSEGPRRRLQHPPPDPDDGRSPTARADRRFPDDGHHHDVEPGQPGHQGTQP
jgi:hypothetical protein